MLQPEALQTSAEHKPRKRTRTLLLVLGSMLFVCIACCSCLYIYGSTPEAKARATARAAERTAQAAHALAQADSAIATATPSPTSTPEATHTPTATPTRTPTITPSPTRTPTATPSPTSKPTNTPSPTSTATNTPEPTPERESARVSKVIDGDTIEVLIDGQAYRVRYIGVDAPEPNDANSATALWGREATAANRRLVEGKAVFLEQDVSETDRYGRLLRYVYLLDGTMVNAALVRLGYAQASTYPPDVRYQDLFLGLQEEAMEIGMGLWGPTPTAVAAAPTPQPTAAVPVVPQPTATQPAEPAAGAVKIVRIFYDGVVPRVESDEYAVIKNVGGSPISLAGWRLNAGNPGQDFWFPDFALQPGQECRVYTNEYHPESCGFSFGNGNAIWANKGDCGLLYDNTGAEVSQYCY